MTEPTPLTAAHLPTIARRVPIPTYDRDAVTTGVVHLGVGGFHRAHQAVYLDALMREGRTLDWGITGVGLLPQDQTMAEAMAAQDCLYTVVVKHPDGTLEPCVVGSMVDYLFAPQQPDAVLDVLAAPTTRVVTLTITEGGYRVDPAERPLEQAPRSAAGYLVAALARRRQAGVAPFTVVSCDNIVHNGAVARRMILDAASSYPALASWIATQVAFPSSMVDRITPVTTEEDRRLLAEGFGLDDAWPVVCEPWQQWVLEDTFGPLGAPPLGDVGVQLVPDVTPYELMKLRLLNAGHQALCYLGHLAGHRYVHEVCQDPLFVDFLLGYMGEEAAPTIPEVAGVDLDRYRHQLIERFANAHVRDTLARLCADSSDRIPPWLLPVAREQLAVGGEVRRVALVVASWARYAEGADEQGRPIEVVDRRRDELMARARQHDRDPLAFLRAPDLLGDLVDEPRFTEPYAEALRSLRRSGTVATLARWSRPDVAAGGGGR